MAKQVQLRRGDAAANTVFVGASGELVMDTTNKDLRVHDGSTVGGFRVPTLVSVQYPNSDNNYTWFRVWSDGWVEQGGQTNLPSVADGSGTSGNSDITLPVEMVDANYFVTTNCAGGSSGWQYYNGIYVVARTTTVLTVKIVSGASSSLGVFGALKASPPN